MDIHGISHAAPFGSSVRAYRGQTLLSSVILTLCIKFDNKYPMTWAIEFYSSKVRIQTLELPDGMVANLIRTLDLIREFGPNLGRPHTASLGKGLYEIRAKGKEGIARSFFCSVQDKKIIILHTIIKKGRKAPKKDMDLAIRRMKEKQNG